MPHEPTEHGPNRDPFPKLLSPRPFNARLPLMLPSLLACPSDTRFGSHTLKNVPMRESKLSLLLSICGYQVRRGDELAMRGASGRWMPVPSPGASESMLDFLRHACERDWPSRTMDANDERLDVVFASA